MVRNRNTSKCVQIKLLVRKKNLTEYKKISSDSFKNIVKKICLLIIYIQII